MRRLIKVVLAIGLTYAVACVAVFAGMSLPPHRFARMMSALPAGVLFTTLPVKIMWKTARAGHLRPGDPAPDFELPTLHQTDKVRLSSHRGARPVVLVFGSYT